MAFFQLRRTSVIVYCYSFDYIVLATLSFAYDYSFLLPNLRLDAGIHGQKRKNPRRDSNPEPSDHVKDKFRRSLIS